MAALRSESLLNPVLVKEVRQALRGRTFAVLFWLTLGAATVISALMLVLGAGEDGGVSGQAFFFANYVCFAIAVQAFVPTAAFQSLGSEWDEHTYDLLVLSDLKPRQIVLGKLLSALCQTGLYLFAFAPFLALSLLLEGFDLRLAAFAIASSLGLSVLFSSWSIMLSSLARVRLARILLMAANTVAIVWGSSVAFGYFALMPMTGTVVVTSGGVVAVYATFVALGSALFLAFACARLAHPEENRSTGVRVMGSAIVLALLGIGTGLYRRTGDDGWLAMAFTAVVLAGVLAIFLASEPERLGRRARFGVPRPRIAAFLAAPWLPGGGRGILWLLVHVLVAAGWTRLVLESPAVATGREAAGFPPALLATGAYTLVYAGLLSGLLARRSEQFAFRATARIGAPLLFLLGLLVPALVRAAAGTSGAADAFRHVGSPVHVIEAVAKGDQAESGDVVALAFIAFLVAAGNAPRVARGLAEAWRASGPLRARAPVAATGAVAER